MANLPSVSKTELGNLTFEPHLALDGGDDGLEKITKLGHQVAYKLRDGGHFLLEIGQGQANAVTGLLQRLFPGTRIDIIPDLAGIERVVSLTTARVSPDTSQLDTRLPQMLN
jgi:release factor glutamine methyltransferase